MGLLLVLNAKDGVYGPGGRLGMTSSALHAPCSKRDMTIWRSSLVRKFPSVSRNHSATGCPWRSNLIVGGWSSVADGGSTDTGALHSAPSKRAAYTPNGCVPLATFSCARSQASTAVPLDGSAASDGDVSNTASLVSGAGALHVVPSHSAKNNSLLLSSVACSLASACSFVIRLL